MTNKVITFGFVVKIAKLFVKGDFDNISNDWEDLVKYYVELKQKSAITLKKLEPNYENKIVFAQQLLKDPESISKHYELF